MPERSRRCATRTHVPADLLARYTGPTYARACRLTGDAELAKDVAQEALVAALLQLQNLRDPERLVAWLTTIIDRTAGRLLEECRGSRQVALEPQHEPRAPHADRPDVVAERDELCRMVRAALDALPSRTRVAVELHYFAGMSCREVGRFLDTSPAAVKMTLHRARRALRRRIRHMSHPETGYPRIAWCNHGKASYKLPLPDLTGDAAQAYSALYHERGKMPSPRSLGMDSGRVERALAYLQRAHLIERRGDRVRCRAPIVNADDQIRLQPWADRLTGEVISRLAQVEPAVQAVARRINATELQASTLRWAGLVKEASWRPFERLFCALDTATPEKGEFGPYTVVYGTEDADPAGPLAKETRRPRLTCGAHHEEPGKWILYELKGHGQDVSTLWKFCDKWGLRRLYGFTWCLRPLLERTASGPIRVADVPHLIISHEDPNGVRFPPEGVDAIELSRDLAMIRAVTMNDDDTVSAGAVPVVSMADWQMVLDAYGQIAADINARLHEHIDDLRARVARCSFAECDFDQVVHAALALLAEPIRLHAQEAFDLSFPPAAGMDWGCLVVTASRNP